MMYAHDKMSDSELDQVKRYRLNHRIDAGGTLPPAIDWKDIAELAVRQPPTIETFLPGLTVRQSPWHNDFAGRIV